MMMQNDKTRPDPLKYTPGVLDDHFVAAYRDFLRVHNRLSDCCIPSRGGRFTNLDLERFRNNACLQYIQRNLEGRRVYRGQFTPSMGLLTAHLAMGGKEHTIWATNDSKADVLLMLADIDNKHGTGDPEGAAKYISDQYLQGHSYIEHSTGGLGRHAYFKLDVKYHPRGAVWDGLAQLAKVVRDDPAVKDFGVVFDRFLGLPTIWKQEGDEWVIEKRGDLLKLPYVADCDLRRLIELPVLEFEDLLDRVRCFSTILNQEDISNTNVTDITEGTVPRQNDPDGHARRVACCSWMMRRTNGHCTAEEVLAAYHQHYAFTGDSAMDIQKRLRHFTRLLGIFHVSFRPAWHGNSHARPFQPGQYLDLVKRLVPYEAFQWDQRHLINHERLADFVGIKIQDAFFAKDDKWFAMASRDATLANFRVLKSKGLTDWICTPNRYGKLLEIAQKYGLLRVYEEQQLPGTAAEGRKITRKKGKARMIGPGPVLAAEYQEFQALYTAWKARQQVQQSRVA